MLTVREGLSSRGYWDPRFGGLFVLGEGGILIFKWDYVYQSGIGTFESLFLLFKQLPLRHHSCQFQMESGLYKAVTTMIIG